MKSKFFSRHSVVLPLLVVFILCVSVAIVAYFGSDISAKQTDLQELQAQLQELQMENNQIKYLITDADEAELYEHLARERGYVYPDEKIFYNVTPGN